MSIELAKHKAADIQLVRDSSGAEVPQCATYSIPFALAKKIVESAPAPKRPIRNRPLHDVDLPAEMAAWDEASDEALENFDKEFPPTEA